MTEYKPYLLKDQILPVIHGKWTNTRAKLSLWMSWRAVDTGAGEVKIFETWRCDIDQRNEKGEIVKEFNLSEQKEFEVPENLLSERRRHQTEKPARYAAACAFAQKLANEAGEPFGLWYAGGIYQRRQLRFIEETARIENVFYPEPATELSPAAQFIQEKKCQRNRLIILRAFRRNSENSPPNASNR